MPEAASSFSVPAGSPDSSGASVLGGEPTRPSGIFAGAKKVKSVYLGTLRVKEVYLGSKKIL